MLSQDPLKTLSMLSPVESKLGHAGGSVSFVGGPRLSRHRAGKELLRPASEKVFRGAQLGVGTRSNPPVPPWTLCPKADVQSIHTRRLGQGILAPSPRPGRSGAGLWPLGCLRPHLASQSSEHPVPLANAGFGSLLLKGGAHKPSSAVMASRSP